MPLVEHDHMIKAIAPDRANQSFDIPVLPRRSRRCRSVANAHRANAPRKSLAIDTVAISNQIDRHWGPAAGFADLPGDPLGSRMRSNANPEDASATMFQHEQPVQQGSTEGRPVS